MRNQWRFLLLRRSSIHNISRDVFHFQVQTNPNLQTFRSFSSVILKHSRHNVFLSSFDPEMVNPRNPRTRNFSSELALEPKDLDQDHVVLTDVFSKSRTNDEIKSELESNSIVISHELVLKVLQNLDERPDIAQRFFDWVSANESSRLSSKSYNLMLGVLGGNGLVNEFWDLVGIMKKKGYGVSKGGCVRVTEKFEKEGLGSDLEKLRDVFASKTGENSVEKVCSRICKVVREDVWGDDVEGRLRDLNVTFSSNLVAMILESVSVEPMKALIFFRWIEESHLFKHDEHTYNAMVRVLGREDCIEKFWRVVDEMRGRGFEMEVGTYVKVLGRFYKRKMIKEAVDLYEFAMGGANKPSVQDCTFLLRKIVVSKELDMDLFARVVRIFTENGNVLTNSTLDAVLRSLTSVGRFGECNKILKAMEERGFVANGTLQSKIAFRLSSAGRKDEASEFMDNMEASGCNPNYKAWACLIEGHCVAGDLDKAHDCFRKMVEREGVSCAGYAFELLVNAYCLKNREKDACMHLSDLVSEKQLKPLHTTYQILIREVVGRGGFKDPLNLLGLMKNHGFPPFLDPFIKYISKVGSADDAIIFLKAMTVKKFPSTSVFLRVFEAFFKAGRHNEAQDFLSRCPGYIRNHADVLNLFCSMKSAEVAAATAIAA